MDLSNGEMEMTALSFEQAVAELEARGVPTDSVIRGAQHVNDLMLSPTQAHNLLLQMTGEDVDGAHHMYTPLTYGYLVQNVLRAHLAQQSADLLDLLTRSKQQAEELIEKQAWMFIASEDDRADIENADPEVVKAGKAKKGARKVLGLRVYKDKIEGKDLKRKEAVAILVDEVGLTPAGASTYYANFKSGKWA